MKQELGRPESYHLVVAGEESQSLVHLSLWFVLDRGSKVLQRGNLWRDCPFDFCYTEAVESYSKAIKRSNTAAKCQEREENV